MSRERMTSLAIKSLTRGIACELARPGGAPRLRETPKPGALPAPTPRRLSVIINRYPQNSPEQHAMERIGVERCAAQAACLCPLLPTSGAWPLTSLPLPVSTFLASLPYTHTLSLCLTGRCPSGSLQAYF